MKKNPIHTSNKLTACAAALLLAVVSAPAAVISVNFIQNPGNNNQQIDTTETFGIDSLGTVVGGWYNVNSAVNYIADAEGNATTVSLTVAQPNGQATFNSAYANTPLLAGFDDYPGTTSPTSFTLNNLATNFPNGYKLIVYVGGYNAMTGASVSDGTTTYYYQPLNPPSAPVTFVQTTQTVDQGAGNEPVAQYAVFGNSVLLTNDTITVAVHSLYANGAGLCGFQIVGASVNDLTARIWSGAANNDWDTSTQNWTNNYTGTTNYTEGEAVTFNDQAVAASPTVNLTADHSPSSMMVDATKDYTLTGSAITGSTSLTKKGSGSLTLSNSNNYTGDTTISGGTLKVGASGAIPGGAGHGNVSVALGTTLDLNGFDAGINGLTGFGTVDNTGSAATLTVGLNDFGGEFDGTIQGATTLAKQGTNTITLTGYSYPSGDTLVQQGTLSLNPAGNFASSGALVVSNGATLALNVTNGAGISSPNVSFNGGTGLVVEYGDASLSAYATPINDYGTLNLNGVTQVGISGFNFSVGTYTLITYSSKTGSGSISSTPASLPTGMMATIQDTGSAIVLNVTFPSIQTLSYTYGDGGIWGTNTGSTYWNLGTAAYTEYSATLGDAVEFGTSYNSTPLSGGTVSLTTDVHPYTVVASGSYTLTGTGRITGATGLTMAGGSGATFVLDNTNTFTGVTTISGGSLQVNNASALGSATNGTVVESGGSLVVSNGITLSDEPITLNGNGTGGNNGALRTVETNSPTTVSAPITLGSTARIRPADGGELVLSGPITDNGSNYVLFLHAAQVNTVVDVNSASNSVGQVTLFGGNPNLGVIRFGVDNAFPSSLVNLGGGLFDLNGTSQTFAGLGNGYGPANGLLTNSSATTSTLTVDYSGTNSAQLLSTISGPVNIVKEGTGLQSFGGGPGILHTYSGTTTINAGILGLASDLSEVTNSFIVNAGGALRGISTIGGPLTVNPGGSFYAGYATNALGTFTISNNLTLAGNTIVAVDKDLSPSNDVINVSGALSYGGTLTIYNLGTNALVAGDTFAVFPPGGTGSFSSIVSDPSVTWSFNDGVLTVVSVAPPTGPTLGYTALGGGVLQFNWTGAYKLQWQTNALGTGLSTNWVDYPDTNNPVNVTNDPAVPAAFYRLAPQ